MNKVIEVKNLNKKFKISKRPKGLPGHISNFFVPKFDIKEAVIDMNFDVYEGETVGFIGANGAGKSTTIKILSGILYPDSGSVKVLGYIPYKDRVKYVSNIGVVFGQKSQLSWDLPVIDSFELLKHIYKMEEATYQSNLKEFREVLGLDDFINQPVRQLSLGQRMRADIAASLLHSPKLVFFDEPTIGLDVVAKAKIRDFTRFMNDKKGTTFIFTTHDMQDIVKTCKRLILIDKGRKMYDGNVKGLVDEYGGITKLKINFDYKIPSEVLVNIIGLKTKLELSNECLSIEERENNEVEITFQDNMITTSDIITAIASEHKIFDFRITEMDIEDIVRKIYEGGIEL